MEILDRIKRLVARHGYRFTDKALDELAEDGLDGFDAVEAILNASEIKKRLRSTSRAHAGERLYVIEAPNFQGTLIYP